MTPVMPPENLYRPLLTPSPGTQFPNLKRAQGEEREQWMQDFERLNTAAPTSGTMPTTLNSMRRPALAPSTTSGAGKGFIRSPGFKGLPGSPEITTPTYDTGRVESLAQRFAAPGVRNLRAGLQDVQQGVFDNPNVKRMTLREALQGYGSGLESVMAGALGTASNIYGQEYGAKVGEAQQNRGIASSERMQGRAIASNERIAELNNHWRDYLANIG